jgi:hypothetical protein
MKKLLGIGWQYVVYDIGGGRVRKEIYSKPIQFLVIFCMSLGHPMSPGKTWRELKRVNKEARTSTEYLKKIYLIIDMEMLGNPTFGADTSYDQDIVIPLQKIFFAHDILDQKKLIDLYIKLIHRTWMFGFADSVFNFSKNNGINKNGMMVQMDFGELLLSHDDVARQIQEKRWMHSFSYSKIPTDEVREYYKKQMDEHVTLKKLDELWNACVTK